MIIIIIVLRNTPPAEYTGPPKAASVSRFTCFTRSANQEIRIHGEIQVNSFGQAQLKKTFPQEHGELA
jgi:hypothetical protein